jgi:hypothetical protein
MNSTRTEIKLRLDLGAISVVLGHKPGHPTSVHSAFLKCENLTVTRDQLTEAIAVLTRLRSQV